ncbi:MAG: hypothetical protein M3361_18605 [Candidatus Tectomicrobia bacterium]|nr:hypothetical protein [Candidatus Tectomicrobia bacterium]
MHETAGVRNDILDFLRDNRLDVGDPLHEGPFYVQQMLHYDAKQKAAFNAAVEELVAEGLVEKREDTVILTAKGKEAIS